MCHEGLESQCRRGSSSRWRADSFTMYQTCVHPPGERAATSAERHISARQTRFRIPALMRDAAGSPGAAAAGLASVIIYGAPHNGRYIMRQFAQRGRRSWQAW
jgi:hypothetical protein